jgi:hypothetical protein
MAKAAEVTEVADRAAIRADVQDPVEYEFPSAFSSRPLDGPASTMGANVRGIFWKGELHG